MSAFTAQSADDISIATIRALAADVVGKANSGHPGVCLRFRSGREQSLSLFSPQVLPWAWHLLRTSFSPGTSRDLC